MFKYFDQFLFSCFFSMIMKLSFNFLYQITFERILKIAKLHLSLHAPFPCERTPQKKHFFKWVRLIQNELD